MALSRIRIGLRLSRMCEEVEIFAPHYAIREQQTGITEEEYYGKTRKCLWLLHGMADNCDDWTRFSRINLYAEEKGIFVICPYGSNAFYTDNPGGTPWETRITEDVWNYLHQMFHMMSTKPEDNMIAGFSMGGYGAMRFAMRHPDKFGFCAAFSSGVEAPIRWAQGENINGHMEQCFGPADKVLDSDFNLYTLVPEAVKKMTRRPDIYMSCGTLDWEITPNKRFRDFLIEQGFNVTWDEAEYGHEWRFWDQQIEKALNLWIPENIIPPRHTPPQMQEYVAKGGKV